MTRSGIEQLKLAVQALVDAEGLRPLAARHNISLGVIRGLLDDRNPTYSSVERLAGLVGWDVSFMPRGPGQGMAETQAVFMMDRPAGAERARLSELPPDEPFYFRAEFEICDRLGRGWHALVEPAVELQPGDLVYGQDQDRAVAVFRWLGDSNTVPTGMLVDPFVFGQGHESWSRSDFVRLHPVTWTGRTPPRTILLDKEPPAPWLGAKRLARLDDAIAELQALRRGEASPSIDESRPRRKPGDAA